MPEQIQPHIQQFQHIATQVEACQKAEDYSPLVDAAAEQAMKLALEMAAENSPLLSAATGGVNPTQLLTVVSNFATNAMKSYKELKKVYKDTDQLTNAQSAQEKLIKSAVILALVTSILMRPFAKAGIDSLPIVGGIAGTAAGGAVDGAAHGATLGLGSMFGGQIGSMIGKFIQPAVDQLYTSTSDSFRAKMKETLHADFTKGPDKPRPD